MRKLMGNMLFQAVIVVMLIISGTGLVESATWGSPAPESVYELINGAFPYLSISGVETTPVQGLYQVVADENVIYFHAETGLLFIGEILTSSGENITARRKEELLAKRLQSIPLEAAVRIGDGPVRVIEVSDPDCPYCRRAHEYLEARSNEVSRFVFFYPLDRIHPQAEAKSLYILCSDEPAEAYRSIYSGEMDGKDGFSVEDSCWEEKESVLQRHREVASLLKVKGTPTFVIAGQLVQGANTDQIGALISRSLEGTAGDDASPAAQAVSEETRR